MGRQIIKQPDGKYCIFSSIVDDFTLWNATKEELIEDLVDCEREKIVYEVDRVINKLEAGGKPYYQFTKDFNEAVESVMPDDSEA